MIDPKDIPASAKLVRLEYDEKGNFIIGHYEDGGRSRVADIRGWGHLTSGGDYGTACALDTAQAVRIQESWGHSIADAWNKMNSPDEFQQGEGQFEVSDANKPLYEEVIGRALLYAKTWARGDVQYIAAKVGADRAVRHLLHEGYIQPRKVKNNVK